MAPMATTSGPPDIDRKWRGRSVTHDDRSVDFCHVKMRRGGSDWVGAQESGGWLGAA